MSFDSTYNTLMQQILFEDTSNKVTAIFPGGFKPPHKGHFELAKSYANDPLIETVKILLGPTKRESKDGSIVIGIKESTLIWEEYYLPALPLGKVQLISMSNPNPMRQAFDYIQENTVEGDIVTLVSSKKDAKDAQRALDFSKKHEEDTGRYYKPGVSVVYHPSDDVALYEDRTDKKNERPISASIMREDAAKGDVINFTTNIPEEVQPYAADILNIITNEG